MRSSRRPGHPILTRLSAAATVLALTALPLPGFVPVSLAQEAAARCAQGGEADVRGYRVVTDPASRGLNAAELSAALKDKGIADHYTVKSGAQDGQLALGFFSQRENAEAMIARMESLGFDASAVTVYSNPDSSDCASDGQASPSTSAPAAAATPETAPAPVDPPEGCVKPASRYIVLADPEQNGGDALALVERLRGEGLSDLFVITADSHRGQVAVGIYDNAEAAQAQVAKLTGLGIRVRSEKHAAVGRSWDCTRDGPWAGRPAFGQP